MSALADWLARQAPAWLDSHLLTPAQRRALLAITCEADRTWLATRAEARQLLQQPEIRKVADFLEAEDSPAVAEGDSAVVYVPPDRRPIACKVTRVLRRVSEEKIEWPSSHCARLIKPLTNRVQNTLFDRIAQNLFMLLSP